MARRNDLVERLAEIPLFSRCTRSELKTVARHVELIDFPAGAPLMAEGDDGDALFVILEGEVSVSAEGRPSRLLGEGDHVGELALLDRLPRTATVIARTDVKAAALSLRLFRVLLREYPSISEQLLAALAGELRAARRQLEA